MIEVFEREVLLAADIDSIANIRQPIKQQTKPGHVDSVDISFLEDKIRKNIFLLINKFQDAVGSGNVYANKEQTLDVLRTCLGSRDIENEAFFNKFQKFDAISYEEVLMNNYSSSVA